MRVRPGRDTRERNGERAGGRERQREMQTPRRHDADEQGYPAAQPCHGDNLQHDEAQAGHTSTINSPGPRAVHPKP